MTARALKSRFGFTLIEMLVSLAVLAVALSVVGVVFTITTRTATQAAAVSEAQTWVREWMHQIEQDLRNCNPSESVLVIAGRTQAAALTQDKLAAQRYYRVLVGDPTDIQPAGYNPEISPTLDTGNANDQPEYSDPRADILMFFTKRPSASQNPATDLSGTSSDDLKQRAYANGAKLSQMQVVYGHGSPGEAELQSNGTYRWSPRLRHIEETIDNANKSTSLSRIPASRWHLGRRATLIDALPPAATGQKYVFPGDSKNGEYAALLRCQGADPKRAGDVVKFSLPDYLAEFSRSTVITNGPYGFRKWGTASQNLVENILYPSDTRNLGHVLTVLENAPAELRSNLGVQLLPGCAWFQVEFLMPEDPRNSLDYDDEKDDGGSKDSDNERHHMAQWKQVESGETYVFIPDTQANRDLVIGNPFRFNQYATTDGSTGQPPTVEKTRVRLWPYAIRVTVRVFDPRGKLTDPIVRSFVHRFD